MKVRGKVKMGWVIFMTLVVVGFLAGPILHRQAGEKWIRYVSRTTLTHNPDGIPG
jgi:hypothetical protein